MVPAFWSELPAIVEDIDRGARARAIVISSTGKHFCAGMDLAVFTGDNALARSGGAEELGRKRAFLWMMVQHLQDSFTALEQARMPVLAAIQGGCIGGAVDMVSAADMRYCSADAFFCVQEINIGMTADVGTLQRLPKIIPEGVARELAYTGDRMPAERALAVGLVNEVFADHDAVVEGTLAVAARIARHSPLAIWGTKESINYARDRHRHDGGVRRQGRVPRALLRGDPRAPRRHLTSFPGGHPVRAAALSAFRWTLEVEGAACAPVRLQRSSEGAARDNSHTTARPAASATATAAAALQPGSGNAQACRAPAAQATANTTSSPRCHGSGRTGADPKHPQSGTPRSRATTMTTLNRE
jgi:enoyl-CoA hydratase